jgi:hypothetical protein
MIWTAFAQKYVCSPLLAFAATAPPMSLEHRPKIPPKCKCLVMTATPMPHVLAAHSLGPKQETAHGIGGGTTFFKRSLLSHSLGPKQEARRNRMRLSCELSTTLKIDD